MSGVGSKDQMRKKMSQGPQLGHHGKRAGGRRQGPEQSRQADLDKIRRRLAGGAWGAEEWEEATVTLKFPVGW